MCSSDLDKDIDVDVKLGTVLGFNGETLRGLELRVSRRSGVITSLALNAKLGRDAPLTGEVRPRGNNGRPFVVVETNDAGAFFRFNDIAAKVVGGEMWVALDPQSADLAPQDRKSTRLNSSHVRISYAVFCLKKKNRA